MMPVIRKKTRLKMVGGNTIDLVAKLAEFKSQADANYLDIETFATVHISELMAKVND